MLYQIFNNLIHAPNNIFYSRSCLNREIHKDFKLKGYNHEFYNKDFSNLSKDIFLFCNSTLNLKNIAEKAKNIDSKKFTLDITNQLSSNINSKCNKIFTSEYLTNKVSSMLNTRLKFRNYKVLYNFYNEKNKKDEGSKMWHRDSDSLSDQIKIFIPVIPISEQNGMFYFISNEKVKESVQFQIDLKRKKNPNVSIWNKFRISDEQVKKHLLKEDINQLTGNVGEALYIDTSKVYHKGGYVSAPHFYRLMIQVVFTPIISLSDWNINNNKILKFFQIKLTNLKNKLKKNI